jgi:hypothetical protein
MRVRDRRAPLLVCLLVLLAPSLVIAQQPAAAESEELAKKLANPISDLVSVPLQFNWEEKVGPSKLTRFILNVQPVMPFELNPKWNLIARVIMPFVGQPPLVEGGVATGGISDITTSFFFAPRGKGKLTVGFGPAIVLPSTSEPTLGSGKWSLGPTIVALEQNGPWTYGVLWNQVWSIAGDPARSDVDQMFLQPFLAYQATHTVTLTLQSETVGNWDAEEGQKWTVPINVLVSKLSTFGAFPASYMFGVGGFVAHPDAGPSWKIRAAIVLLLPKRK